MTAWLIIAIVWLVLLALSLLIGYRLRTVKNRYPTERREPDTVAALRRLGDDVDQEVFPCRRSTDRAA